LAIAQQEAVYNMARQRQQHRAPDPKEMMVVPNIRVSDMAE